MTSLYRKWRSRSFEDLLGQDHVVRTLRNAVRQKRVAHAYLFTGPRGTGKTSAARILAKAVNCLDPTNGNPCTVCETCRAAQEGRTLDVIEIDAASNTSVEHVRDLRDRVAYAAGEGEYKVYIVDEVHRLSGAAFDAFLKTLEEPPPHVIFVFASTEPHKVPATIASRCQRFDFRRISRAEIQNRLVFVAGAEGLTVGEGALALIAQYANGSLRDALGLLDQVAAYAEGQIEEADIRQSLGLADPTVVARMTDALLHRQVGTGLDTAARFVAAGGDPQQLTTQLIGYWRALLLAVSGAESHDLAVDPGLESDLKRHAQDLDERRILLVLRALSDQEFSAKYDLVASLPLEVGYVQAGLALRDAASVAPSSPPPPSPDFDRPASIREAAPQPEERSSPAPSPLPSQTEEAPPALAAAAPAQGDSDIEQAWNEIVARMRPRSAMLQAVLRSGFLLKAEDGELTVGFLFDFHSKKFAEVKNRRLLEEVIQEVLGSTYRVQCVRTTKEEIETVRGAGTVVADDGFIEEVAEKLRQYHAKQISNGGS